MIELKNVSYSYNKEEYIEVISDINLKINSGENVAIIGSNGSGKSTLAKIINGILVPDKGSVVVDGFTTNNEVDIWEIRKRVGVVFQNPDNQIVATIVEEDVAFGLENIGVKTEKMSDIILKSLSSVNMQDYIKKPPHMLSGGQKQRVAIAGILAMKPNYFIFDESTSMLDPKGVADVLNSITMLKKEGYGIVYITHFLTELIYFDRVIVLDKGRIVYDNSVEHFFKKSDIAAKLGFKLPPVIQLSKEISKVVSSFPICYTVDKFMEAICQYN